MSKKVDLSEFISHLCANDFIMQIRKLYSKTRLSVILPHLLFWLFSIVLFIIVLFYTRGFSVLDIDFKTAINILTTIFLLAISVYINLLWLLPTFFKRRKFMLFTLLELANIILFILLNFYISVLFEGNGHPNFATEVIAEFILVFTFLLVTSLLKFVRDSITLQDVELKIKEIERQQIEAELKALKAQINPHFFFNTLNSLYSLALDKSEKAPELILKLSELMRYVIYEAKEDLVAFSRQIEFLRSYVYLENLRSGEKLLVDFTVRGKFTDLKIAPLIFIPFIENAFKHGIKIPGSHPYISIRFDVSELSRLHFFIKNNKDRNPDGKKPEVNGIGLQNVRKRLNLLYPNKHFLAIQESDDEFIVNLTLYLS